MATLARIIFFGVLCIFGASLFSIEFFEGMGWSKENIKMLLLVMMFGCPSIMLLVLPSTKLYSNEKYQKVLDSLLIMCGFLVALVGVRTILTAL